MKDSFLKNWHLSNREQKGVIGLIGLLFVLLLVHSLLKTDYFNPPLASETAELNHDWNQYLAMIDTVKTSLTATRETEKTPPNKSIHPFDPNLISEEELVSFGLPTRTVKAWVHYREKGGRFYKKEDVGKIYTLSEEDFQKLAPFLVFQNKKTASNNFNDYPKTNSPKNNFTIEINKASVEDFQKLRGIGPVLSSRIIKFRDALGGFYKIDQIKETYGLTDSTFQIIKRQLQVNPNLIQKLSLNTAKFKSLGAHPYLRKYSKEIMASRKKDGNFNSVEEIKTRLLINEENYRKIAPYLTL